MDVLFVIIGGNAEGIGKESLYAAGGEIISCLLAEEAVSTGAESKTLAAGKATLDIAYLYQRVFRNSENAAISTVIIQRHLINGSAAGNKVAECVSMGSEMNSGSYNTGIALIAIFNALAENKACRFT